MMTGVQRAKQFAPFSALKGLDDAMLAMEKVKVERIELAEDAAERLNTAICRLSPGRIVTVRYWLADEYVNLTGIFGGIDTVSRVMTVAHRAVPIDDVIALSAHREKRE